MVNQDTSSSESLANMAKNAPTIDIVIKTIKESKEMLLWGVAYAGVGFIAGFFFKILSRYLVMLLLVSGFLFALHSFGILTIDINFIKIKAMLGIGSAMSYEEMIMCLVGWVKNNIFIAFMLVVGFMLGVVAS